MLKYFVLAVVLLQIQVGSAYANNSDINKGLKDEQSYQLNFQKLKQGKPSSQAELYYNSGNARYELGDKQGAIDDYTLAANFFLQQGDMENYLKVLQNISRIQGR
ncbi:hypothetical protein MEN41_05485 [Dolichospermum sp. ST_con]|nr:hypothetical protein [Dolichospermum sp. ST_con]MDD1421297.1 hypothetical protein [Dolichospermum sp. ST_sed1]MDD1428798.1 hypothetical protein [Dolichospermum sp. ST_sed9]MDD1430490.1 hypothetical protein [Dolichospermum sp. ST_sed6]MDD1439183.1 hypothetical protein [Dolichospermum sp. ST_sed3]MDD1445252.1 hypothetical protein [Dolichospermum sp. ST_sed8]MDD1456795.1 hypothetical protein [Dolichospermum sp. ST_sed7]MDD1459677.1 hypothetical protein [Dolichospermum sp. ST_sed2]MDD1470422